MVEKIEDLYLPAAVVTRLIKEVLPPTASISKEARIAISRAASVFVIYLTSTATTMKSKTKLKTITGDDILQVLKQLEFENFIEPLTEHLEKYRKSIKDKKDAKKSDQGENKNDDDGEEENTDKETEEK